MTSDLLATRLREMGFDANRIVMEVTEYGANDELRLSQATQRFKRAHYKVAIDDFGSKYSSKKRVSRIKPDIIKFDRSLIENYLCGNQQPLLDAVLLAKQSDVTMVQEGIETQAHLDVALSLGIHWLQGYFFHRPEPFSYSLKKVNENSEITL